MFGQRMRSHKLQSFEYLVTQVALLSTYTIAPQTSKYQEVDSQPPSHLR